MDERLVRNDPIARETRALVGAMRADGFSDAYIARVLDEPSNAARLTRHYGIEEVS